MPPQSEPALPHEVPSTLAGWAALPANASALAGADRLVVGPGTAEGGVYINETGVSGQWKVRAERLAAQ